MEIYSPLPGAVSGALFTSSACRNAAIRCRLWLVHFALVPLFINPRDGAAGDSGLMSADFARELRASYGAFSPPSWRSPLTPEPTLLSEIFRAGIQCDRQRARWGPAPRAGHAVVDKRHKVILPQAFRCPSFRRLGNNAIAIVSRLVAGLSNR